MRTWPTPLSVIGGPPEAIFRTGVDREGIGPPSSNARGFGRDSTMTGTGMPDTGSTSEPDPLRGGPDDPARPRPPDDGMPLA